MSSLSAKKETEEEKLIRMGIKNPFEFKEKLDISKGKYHLNNSGLPPLSYSFWNIR